MILARIFSNFYTHKKKKKKEENLQKFKNANSTFREIRSKCLRLFSPFFLFLMAYKYFFWLFFLSFSDFFFSRESAKCHLDEKRKDTFTAVYSEAREVFFSLSSLLFYFSPSFWLNSRPSLSIFVNAKSLPKSHKCQRFRSWGTMVFRMRSGCSPKS